MRIGVDLGGTKIEAVALDAAGRETGRLRVPTPRGDYPGTLAAIAGLADALDPARTATVGIGSPGSASTRVDAAGQRLWKGANSTWLNGMPLADDLAAALGRPTRVANDANCFAVSEAVDGAAAGARVVFGVIIGTGVGGGVVVGGAPLAGRNGVAGEWGHTPLPWATPPESAAAPSCYCGRVGCVEGWLSGPGMAADHLRRTGDAATTHAIVAAAASGDPAATATVDLYVERLARALAVIVDVLDPDAIVLGGGMSNLELLYERLPAAVGPHVFSDSFDTPILKNLHGDSSGVRGAAQLWRAV